MDKTSIYQIIFSKAIQIKPHVDESKTERNLIEKPTVQKSANKLDKATANKNSNMDKHLKKSKNLPLIKDPLVFLIKIPTSYHGPLHRSLKPQTIPKPPRRETRPITSHAQRLNSGRLAGILLHDGAVSEED